MSKTKKIVLWLASPYILLIGVAILYALGQVAAGSSAPQNGDLFAQPSGLQVVLNTIVFLIGAIAVILMPVSVVMAIVIGARQPPAAPVQAPQPFQPEPSAVPPATPPIQ